MYTLDQVRAAIKNAQAAGDTEAENALLKAAMQMASQQAPKHASSDPSAGGGTFQIGSYDTGLKTPEWMDRVLAGAGRGMYNVGRHVLNMLPGGMSDQQLADAAALDAPLMDTKAGKFGSFLGESAVTAPLLGGVANVAGRAALGARVLANPITRGVAEGAVQGAVMADPGDKLTGALIGGTAGAVLPGAMKAGGRVIRGVEQTAGARALRARGVDLTPGQMNPTGIANQVETAAQSLPIVGPAIKTARDNAETQFQRSVIGEGAMGPVQGRDVHELLQSAYDSFQPAYDAAKGFPVFAKIMTNTGQDVPLGQALKAAVGAKSVLAPNSVRNSVGQVVSDAYTMLSRGRQLSSDDLLQFRSVLRQQARDAALSNDTAGRAAAKLFANAETQVTKALESQLPADAMGALRAADAKYTTYKVLEDAVAKAKDNVAGLTPAKLSQAVYAATPDGAYARGAGGTLRDLAQQGGEAFQSVTPPTGARLATLGAPAAAIYANPMLGIPASLGTLGLVTTQAGRRMAAGETGMQRAAQRALGLLQQNTPQTVQGLLSLYANPTLLTGGRYLLTDQP